MSCPLGAIPLQHHREWITSAVRRSGLGIGAQLAAMQRIAELYSDRPAARGFGPLGYEDVTRLVWDVVVSMGP